MIQLNGTGSSDPDNDPLTFLWTTDCPGGTFDDPTNPTPTLTAQSFTVTCNVTITVTDNSGASDTCFTTVTITDTTAPVLTVDTTPITATDVDCSGAETVTLPLEVTADVDHCSRQVR